jgi:carbonic anhydrase
MKFFKILLILLPCTLSALTSQEVLNELKLGNQRFYENKPRNLENLVKKRLELEEKQSPVCTVVTCADSRVTPEIIFDQPLGRLFVIRVAGNVMSEGVLESLIYAVDYLKTPLVVVMGHENCGLVEAVKENPGMENLESLIALALPYVKQNMSLEEAVKNNARGQAFTAKTVLDIPEKNIKAAYYNFGTGKVTFYKDLK